MGQIVLPNILANGTTIDANALNSNFETIYAAFNDDVDNTNVGAAGFFASQIIATSPGNATFGGLETYTFLYGLNVEGTLQTNSTQATNGTTTSAFLFPVYNGATGLAFGSGRIVIGSGVTGAGGTVTITLTGAAAFTATFYVQLTVVGSGAEAVSLDYTTTVAPCTFTVTASSSGGVPFANVSFTYLAIGV